MTPPAPRRRRAGDDNDYNYATILKPYINISLYPGITFWMILDIVVILYYAEAKR